MNGLDSVTRTGIATAPPEGDILSVVHTGLDSIRRMIEQGKTKDADAVLDFLSSILGRRFTADATGATDPQPYTLPPGVSSTPPSLSAAFTLPSAGTPPNPIASDSGVENRIEGLPQNIATALRPGSREWTSVMTVLQQHESVHFDADSQRFFTTLSDGSKVDLCSVYDVEDILDQNGGFSGNEAGAIAPVADFMKQKVDEAYRRPFTATNTLAILAGHTPPPPDSSRVTMETFHSQVDDLKRRLAELEAALELLHAPSQLARTVVR